VSMRKDTTFAALSHLVFPRRCLERPVRAQGRCACRKPHPHRERRNWRVGSAARSRFRSPTPPRVGRATGHRAITRQTSARAGCMRRRSALLPSDMLRVRIVQSSLRANPEPYLRMSGRCPYQKLHRYGKGFRGRAITGANTRPRELCTRGIHPLGDDRGAVPMQHGRRPPSGGKRSLAPRATVRRRDVRDDDAHRRGAGLERSGRRSAGAQAVGREHPCPARGEFATRDSRRGTGVGSGATSARSTR